MSQEHLSINVRELSNSFLVFLLLFVSCLLVISTQTANADGKFYPEKAYKVAPAIPSQRAILAYKDGTETLIIESALDGKGKNFGWIIPLPSQPTEFDKASPGLIKSLSLTIQPKIIHDLSRILEPLYIISVVITLGCFLVIAIRPKKITSFVLISFIIVAMLVFSIMTMWAYTWHRGKLGSEHSLGLISVLGVSVLDMQQIGSYDLAVLDANTADALNQWLGRSGFSGLTKRDQKIVTDYIKNGWCFVAARLRREGDGYSRPHPLAMSFPSEKLIYPMRLTATVGGRVYLELFVVTDKTAKCENLTLELCDKYRSVDNSSQDFFEDRPSVIFSGQTYRQNIGHLDARKHMWNGCVVSKLSGIIRPSRIDKDLTIELKPWESYQKLYYSVQGAREVGLIVGLSLCLGLFVLLIAVFYGRIIKIGGRRFAFFRIVMPSALLSLLVCGITYAVLPKTQTKVTEGYHDPRITWADEWPVRVRKLIEENNNLRTMDANAIKVHFNEYFDFRISANKLTGERIRQEDSPGNYTIFESERGIHIRSYAKNGTPIDYLVRPSDLDVYQDRISHYLSLISMSNSRNNQRPRALVFLQHTGDKRVVKPIIDSLEPFNKIYVRNACLALTRLTGYKITASGNEREAYRLWTQWWEQNKDKSRRQWLIAALDQPNNFWNNWGAFVAAQELAKLGDDAGIPILLKQLNISDGFSHNDAALALVRLGRQEGYKELESIFVAFAALVRLQVLLSEKPNPVNEIEKEVNILAPIIRVVPPLDVTNKKKMAEFVAKSNAWCIRHSL